MWNEDMLKFNYEDVVNDLHEYIVQVGYVNRNLEVTFQFDGIGEQLGSGYREFSFLTTKCVTSNIPLKEYQIIGQFWFMLDQSIVNEGQRLDAPSDFMFDENQLIVVPHYPNQLSEKIATGMRIWTVRDENSETKYVMQLTFEMLRYWKEGIAT